MPLTVSPHPHGANRHRAADMDSRANRPRGEPDRRALEPTRTARQGSPHPNAVVMRRRHAGRCPRAPIRRQSAAREGRPTVPRGADRRAMEPTDSAPNLAAPKRRRDAGRCPRAPIRRQTAAREGRPTVPVSDRACELSNARRWHETSRHLPSLGEPMPWGGDPSTHCHHGQLHHHAPHHGGAGTLRHRRTWKYSASTPGTPSTRPRGIRDEAPGPRNGGMIPRRTPGIGGSPDAQVAPHVGCRPTTRTPRHHSRETARLRRPPVQDLSRPARPRWQRAPRRRGRRRGHRPAPCRRGRRRPYRRAPRHPGAPTPPRHNWRSDRR